MSHKPRQKRQVSRSLRLTLTIRQIADLLGIPAHRVYDTEKRALEKMRRHPIIRQMAQDCGIATDDEEMEAA